MNTLILSRYDRLGASSRLRQIQFAPALLAAGISNAILPLFPDIYLSRLYAGRSTTTVTTHAYGRRLTQRLRPANADVIWLEKEFLPWLPWLVERAVMPRSAPLVTDYDDAVFHAYDLHRSGAVRQLLGHKIDRVMAASAMVTAGNAYLADRARTAGAPRVVIVPTVVDITAYGLAPTPADGMPAVIGWIGTPSTWSAYLAPMLGLLTGVAQTHGARLTAIGASGTAPHSLVDILPWSEETEVADIQRMDIGIMPLTDTPWSRGKCGYKLLQYMACGLPVVASPVGVNADIVEHGVNGFLATTEAEWREALTALLRDPGLRQRMGQEGRRKVERDYSLQVWGPRVAALLRDVAEKGR